MLPQFLAKIRQRLASAGDGTSPVSWRGYLAVGVLVVAGGLFAGHQVLAADTIFNYIALALASLLNILIAFVGQLLLIMVGALIWVAEYRGFVDSYAVAQGWSITRDVANMFFIVIMLVLAFGTILGSDEYGYKKHLSKLLLMAVIVNFSRTICGLIIDFAQVVMMTFVYGFREAAGGNFANALRLTKLMQVREDLGPETQIDAWSIAVGMLLALIMVIISLVVVTMMTITLAVRIVFIWLLVVLSPLAFLLRDVPGTVAKDKYGKWWKMFSSQVVVGPVLAFFLWLSLVSVASDDFTKGFADPTTGAGGETVNGSVTKAFASSEIQSFIIAICLLAGGLKMANEIADNVSTLKGVGAKATKSIKSGLSFAAGANKVARYIPGVANAQNAVKSGALTAASYIPFAKAPALQALSEHRSKIKKAGSDSAAWMKDLTPGERERFESNAITKRLGFLKTPEQKGREKQALAASLNAMGDAKEINKGDRAKYVEKAAALEEAAKRTGDKSIVKDVLDPLQKKRPDLMVDETLQDQDPKKLRSQMEKQKKVVESLSGKQLDELAPAALTPEVLINIKDQQTARNFEDMAAKVDKMPSVTDREKKTKAAADAYYKAIAAEKDRLADDPEYENDQAREKALTKFIRGQKDKSFGGLVLDARGKEERLLTSAAGMSDSDVSQLSVGAIAAAVKVGNADPSTNQDGLKKLIAALETRQGDVRNMKPDADLAAAVGAFSGASPGLQLSVGNKLGEVFLGYNESNGTFDSAGQRAALDTYLTSGDKIGNAAALPASAISQNGGANDVAISMILNMSEPEIKALGEQNGTNAAELIEAASKLAKLDGGDVNEFIGKNANITHTEAEIRQAIKKAVDTMAERSIARQTPIDAEKRKKTERQAEREQKRRDRKEAGG